MTARSKGGDTEVEPVRPVANRDLHKDEAIQALRKRKEVSDGQKEEAREEADDSKRARSSTDQADSNGLGQRMATGSEEEEVEGSVGEANGAESTDEEEGRRPVMAPTPQKVSKREVEEHNLTHTPFRAWCRHCVRGRAKNTPHRRSGKDEDGETKVPRISMDYAFASEKDRRACENPILMVVDESTGEKYARAVGAKGMGMNGEQDWVIKDLSDELKSWGHMGGEGGAIILKCDGEPAICAVRDALARLQGGVRSYLSSLRRARVSRTE